MKSREASEPKIVATLHGINVLSAPHLTRAHIRNINTNNFERPEIEAGLANLRPGDRIVEMGAGSGIVGSIFAKNIDDLRIYSFEANPDLIPHIAEHYARNDVADVITLQNRIVVSADDAPATLEFHISENFLGSQMSDTDLVANSRIATIETENYAELTSQTPHNVLVMDIEGAELEFLRHADLSGIDLIMIELHPKIYGVEGAQECRSILTSSGFSIEERSSQAHVVTYKSAERAKLGLTDGKFASVFLPEKYDLQPDQSIKAQTRVIENAVLAKTPRSEGYKIKASVFDAQRQLVPEAKCWIAQRTPATVERAHPRANRIKHLPGVWLFGGRYFPHFGHFLTESISRLWALDHLTQKIEGVLYFPTYNNFAETAPHSFEQLSTILDVPFNWKICDQFYRVDKLIVPAQGTGASRLMLSSPEFRTFIKRHLSKDLTPTGCDRLYISRSRFTEKSRLFLGENALEALLEKEGYTIFHPQEHSWQEQLRYYQSAKHIVGPDGTPFHLVNYTSRPDLKLSIIQRRPTNDASQLAQQGAMFGVGKAESISALRRMWSFAGTRRASLNLICEVKFSELCAALKAQGMIGQSANWQDLTDIDLKHELGEIASREQNDLYEVTSLTQSLEEHPVLMSKGQPQVINLP